MEPAKTFKSPTDADVLKVDTMEAEGPVHALAAMLQMNTVTATSTQHHDNCQAWS